MEDLECILASFYSYSVALPTILDFSREFDTITNNMTISTMLEYKLNFILRLSLCLIDGGYDF